MNVQPANARYSIAYEGSSLRLKIPSRKHWLQIVFISLWLIFWLGLAVNIVGALVVSLISGFFTQASGSIALSPILLLPGLFGLVWITLFIGIGLYAVYLLLWQLVGYELIEISPQSIRITRKVVGSEKPRIYDAGYIKDLRVSPFLPQSSWPGGYSRQFWTRNTGTLAFDYGAKTIRFGDMDEAEAKMALADILRQYPGYGKAKHIGRPG